MHNPESVLKNEMHKILWHFEMQKDHLISVKRLDLVRVNKKENQPNSELCHPGGPQSKIKRKRKER